MAVWTKTREHQFGKTTVSKIHKRQINSTRAKQIVASYLQGKEYFRNAEMADNSVKPLLLYYGVSSLSRCLTLLLSRYKGEEALNKGHGLTTESWGTILSNDIELSLEKIGNLKVIACNGLFWDLLNATSNISYLHVRSSRVDFSLKYDTPQLPASLKFCEVASRIPDLNSEYELWIGKESINIPVNSFEIENDNFEIKVLKSSKVVEIFNQTDKHIKIEDAGAFNIVKGDCQCMPMLINTFVNKTFDSIPSLYVARNFECFGEIAQIPLTYVQAYYLGMLCRYFPSHWMALSRGNIGDSVWPFMQSSMNYVEQAYPELLMECIEYVTRKGIQASKK